jgi:hypothetical protein
MIPKLKEIQMLKYNVNTVEFDEINNIYQLYQFPNSLENNEFFYSNDKIIKFVRGVKKVKKEKKERKKTQKEETILKSKNKNKTKKLKPNIELILEDEEVIEQNIE